MQFINQFFIEANQIIENIDKIQIEKGVLKIDSNFTIPLADHDIKVPQVVSEKIATEIIVKLNVVLTQK